MWKFQNDLHTLANGVLESAHATQTISKYNDTKYKNANIEIDLHPCVLESVPGTLVKQYKDIEQQNITIYKAKYKNAQRYIYIL